MTQRHVQVIVPGSLQLRTGGSIYDRRMVEGLRRRGWAVTVRELDGRFPVTDAKARADLARSLAGLRDGATAIIDFLAMAGEPDVVRAHAGRLSIIALIHLLPGDEPWLEPSERDRRLALGRKALRACAGVIATSLFTARRLEGLGVPGELIRTVVPGADPAPLAVGPDGDDQPRILCLASVTPGKGQDVLVRALAELADLPWTCVCAGSLTRSPAYAGTVRDSIRDAGLSGRITFPGECDDAAVEELYRTSSVFVLPSFFESYGMVLTEAMARGLPVVSTSAGAIPETVPADAGILVPPGDVGALAGALRSLLADGPDGSHRARRRRTQMGAAARRHASALPDWEQATGHFSRSIEALGATPTPGLTDRRLRPMVR